MKSAYILVTFFLFPVFANVTHAQQEAHYSQYMVNYFILNPGAAGTGENTEVRAGMRSQWTGFENSPKTFYVTMQGPINRVDPKNITFHKSDRYIRRYNPKGYHSAGGYLYHDATGPISRSAIYGAYAYNIGLTDQVRASLGAYLGLKQFRVDGSKLDFFDTNDPLQAGQTEIVPDASIGLWLYSSSFYLGGSIHQVMGNRLEFITNGNGSAALARHYFVTAGLNIKLSEYISWVPSVLVRAVYPAPTSFDINSKFRFSNVAWAGVSYRKDDATVLMAGFTLKGNIDFSYSYDITQSSIRSYSGGTHEVVIGYKLNFKRKTYSPSDFW